MKIEKNRVLQPLILLLLLGFIWGSGYAIARFVELRGNVTPIGYTFWQTLGPAVLLLSYLFVRGNVSFKTFLKHWEYYLITGVLGIVIPNTNMYLVTAHMPSNIVAMVINVSPLMIYPLALIFQQEKFSMLRLFCVLLGVIGIFCVILPKANISVTSITPWVLLALLTPFNFALCTIYISKCRPKDIDSVILSAGMMCMASLVLMPIVFGFHQFYAFKGIFNLINDIILIKIILSSIGYVLLFQLLKIAGPVYYSLVDGVVIITGLFWGWIIFGETLDIWLTVAVVFIISSVLLMSWSNRLIRGEKSRD